MRTVAYSIQVQGHRPLGMAPRQKIVVTGANGFAARFLVKRLCDEGYDVHAADIRALPDDAVFGPIIDKRATFHLVDICDYDSVKLLLKGTYAVFHFAALVPYNLSRSYSKAELLRVNVDATAHLVTASQAAGVRYMIYASSTGVVFRGEDIANGDETWSTSPPLNDPYSESKSMAEHIVLSANRSQPGEGMATVAIRPNGIWGAGGEGHHIPKLLVAAQCGIAPLMAVTPSALTDFTHRANLVHACMCALERLEEAQGRKVVGGKAYFVTDGWPCHTLEFFSPLLQLLGYSSTPFPCSFYPRAWAGRQGVKECGRVGRPQWVDMEAEWAKEQGRKANVQPASPPPTASKASSSGSSSRRGSRAAGQVQAPLLLQSPPADVAEEDEIVVTAEPFLPVPAVLLYLSASLLQLFSLLIRPLVNVEPFLTVADARKVAKHNYYSSARARRELGYTPVITPAQGLRETAAYYAALGYDGRVTPAGWLPWLLAPGGIGAVGLLAGDAWGGGTAMYTAAARIGIPMNAAMRGLQSAVLHAVGRAASQCSPMHSAGKGEGQGAALWLLTLRWVFIAAVVTHLLEACWIGRQTWRWKKACAGWVWQTAWLGFPSMALAYGQAGHSAQGIVPLCLALFTAMAVLTPCLDVLTGCKAWTGHGAM